MTNTFNPGDRSSVRTGTFIELNNTPLVGVNGIRASDHVGVQTESFDIPVTELYTIIPFNLPGFNVNTGGRLSVVKLFMQLHLVKENHIENMNNTSETVYFGTWDFVGGTGGHFINTHPAKLGLSVFLNTDAVTWALQGQLIHTFNDASYAVDAYDGTLDFLGASACSDIPISDLPMQVVATITDPVEIAKWAQHPTQTMAFQRVIQNYLLAPGNHAHYEHLVVTGTITVQYIFTY